MNKEEVLQAYRNGDEGKRLSLFLAYRDVREDFSRIELEICHDDFAIRLPWSRKHRHSKDRLPEAA